MKKLLYFMLLFIIITLTACGSKQYLVSFDSNGGEEIESVYVNLGQRAPAPKEITKEGHTLIGWFYGSEMWSFINNYVTENITLTAKWQINEYTITFDTDGGSKVESITQEYDSRIDMPEDPVKEGYTFIGWDKEVPSTMPAENLTLTALWQAIHLTIDVGEYSPNIYVNGSFELNPILYPIEFSQEFIFETSDSSIVTVDKFGLVKGVSSGYAVIKIISKINHDYYEQISIHVSSYDMLDSLYIVPNYTQLKCNQTLQLSINYEPEEALIGTVTWTVNNPSLATINESGLLTAGQTAGIVKVTATVGELTASKYIKIIIDAPTEYPDLGGYDIKIAHATNALGDVDPFMPEETKAQYGYYGGLDREARQEAWESVEDDFNCTISVVEYPVDAPWGPSRWNYIVNQARLDNSEYDFYIVPDVQIPGFVSANAIIDLTEWYDTYGNGLMNTLNKTAGSYKNKLYSINTGEPAIYNMMGYNYDLWKLINEYDNTIEEPAKMFNDGNWTYSTFVEYSLKVQQALDSMYTGGETKEYYAVSGWPTYYWVGMVDRNGVGVADVTSLQVHLTGADETAAGEAIKSIYAAGAFDPAMSVDGGVASFNGGKALFNTGDLWFIGTNQDRWPAEINYGFVPFPAPDGSDPNKYSVGLTAEACWVMAQGRSKHYAAHGEECTAENIYHAIMQYWLRAKNNYQGSDTYDPEAQIRATASAKFGASQESMKAFITMSNNLNQYAFYDPMTSSSNTVCTTYNSDLDQAIRAFVNGTGAATWNEAVGTYQSTLDKSIVDAFG